MNERDDIRSLQISLAVYFVVFALKLGVYFTTGVMALMAESLHTLSDILVSGFLLMSAYYSRKAADQVHMFGYGRTQNVAAMVAATLFISFTSYKLYEESIPRLFRAGEGTYQNLPLAIGVLVASMLLAAIPLIKLFLQKQRGPAAKAQFLESINDEFGLLAALVGTLFIIWGNPIADPIASIIVATIIAYNGVKLFIENFTFLLGKSPGAEYLAKLETTARSVPGVLGVHDVRAEYIGPDVVHAGLHIEVQRGTSIEEADRIAEEVEQRVHAGTKSGFCIIHVDPAGPCRPCLGLDAAGRHFYPMDDPGVPLSLPERYRGLRMDRTGGGLPGRPGRTWRQLPSPPPHSTLSKKLTGGEKLPKGAPLESVRPPAGQPWYRVTCRPTALLSAMPPAHLPNPACLIRWDRRRSARRGWLAGIPVSGFLPSWCGRSQRNQKLLVIF